MTKRKVFLWLGVLGALTVLVFPIAEMPPLAQRTAAVAVLMVFWWLGEVIPIYMTAFLPAVLFPLLGIHSAAELSGMYGHSYVLMLLGAFLLAKAIECHDLHKRLSLAILIRVGGNKRRLLLGFILVTALLSMWITNMAVVLMLLPLALGILNQQEPTPDSINFSNALLLGIAYAASIGGTATLIGTPPNMVFAGMMQQLFPERGGVDFTYWLKIGLPVVVVFLPVLWIFLVRYYRVSGYLTGDLQLLRAADAAQGKMTRAQWSVLMVFVLTALAWVFRGDLSIGSMEIHGWSTWLGVGAFVHDSTVALGAAILLFLLPDQQGGRLMNWQQAKDIPWGVAMFLGGGLALGMAFKSSGLASFLADQLSSLEMPSGFWLMLLIICAMIFFTEINSNTATATIFLPVLAIVAQRANMDPMTLMIPATFACSFAFMLPSATGTNTVIFASDRITISEMVKVGFWMNLISVVLLTLLLYLVVFPLFDLI
ncbi:SLC13 family permease [Marinoscillum furvescens]|uniref:Sodium-dependent dicarboxylate transporter 2/3/5 n=1 Tax=Marinoscillum furvescens DSM 4134 TaxID=1122208 RepID=A0A3D9L8Z7_MARFU|nr:SLC13 family permease [Marinoscillum furvescens]REE01532.1 sodium-dependent dicarboxylate transporter 2/3/5 [Marinoscillum furvescens DSM 4134]